MENEWRAPHAASSGRVSPEVVVLESGAGFQMKRV